MVTNWAFNDKVLLFFGVVGFCSVLPSSSNFQVRVKS